MNPSSPVETSTALSRKCALLLSLIAIASFHLAYTFNALNFLLLVYLGCLFELSRLSSTRIAFYFGLTIGLACALQASFFWNIFGPSAIALWMILAFWIALFTSLARATRARLGKFPALLLLPFLWTGLEYFRSELYYLRFSWVNVGYVFSPNLAWLPIKFLGMYGIGFGLAAVICFLHLLRAKARLVASTLALASLATLTNLPPLNLSLSIAEPAGNLRIAGVQLEFPSESEAIDRLNKLVKTSPDTQLLVLSEYTFLGPIPDSIKAWCHKNNRHLIVGGKDPVSDSDFRDTVFVVDPKGEIVFRQAKSVPIQFFKDGLPAESQKLWDSPWGKIGICICYDLSYTRVTDQLIRLGAQAIIVPSMDIIDWGKHQHELHARVAPTRAAEYNIPIFRIASSGISQAVAPYGHVLAATPIAAEGATIATTLNLNKPGTLPLDRYLAPFAVAIDALLIVWLALVSITKRPTTSATNPNPQ